MNFKISELVKSKLNLCRSPSNIHLVGCVRPAKTSDWIAITTFLPQDLHRHKKHQHAQRKRPSQSQSPRITAVSWREGSVPPGGGAVGALCAK